MPPIIMQDPQSPDELARLAGQTMYGSRVGMLRRSELWRLGNAWGFKFPSGATKDYMLPYFQQLEANGQNPLRPPVEGNLDSIVKTHDVEHSTECHSETAPMPEVVPAPVLKVEPTLAIIKPTPKSEFESKLETLPHFQIKKLCRERGVPQTPRDRKQDLIARIIASSEGTPDDKDVIERSQ